MKWFTRNFFSFVSGALIANSAFAADPVSPVKTCGEGSAITAVARVHIERVHWVQNGGNYELKSDLVCKTVAMVPVIDGVVGNCTYQNIASCPISLDGNTYTINASANVHIERSSQPVTKSFNSWYHVDRNSGSVTTGESSSAEAEIEDLNVDKIGLIIRSKLDQAVPGHVSRDGVVVRVDFDRAPGSPDAP